MRRTSWGAVAQWSSSVIRKATTLHPCPRCRVATRRPIVGQARGTDQGGDRLVSGGGRRKPRTPGFLSDSSGMINRGLQWPARSLFCSERAYEPTVTAPDGEAISPPRPERPDAPWHVRFSILGSCGQRIGCGRPHSGPCEWSSARRPGGYPSGRGQPSRHDAACGSDCQTGGEATSGIVPNAKSSWGPRWVVDRLGVDSSATLSKSRSSRGNRIVPIPELAGPPTRARSVVWTASGIHESYRGSTPTGPSQLRPRARARLRWLHLGS